MTTILGGAVSGCAVAALVPGGGSPSAGVSSVHTPHPGLDSVGRRQVAGTL